MSYEEIDDECQEDEDIRGWGQETQPSKFLRKACHQCLRQVTETLLVDNIAILLIIVTETPL